MEEVQANNPASRIINDIVMLGACRKALSLEFLPDSEGDVKPHRNLRNGVVHLLRLLDINHGDLENVEEKYFDGSSQADIMDVLQGYFTNTFPEKVESISIDDYKPLQLRLLREQLTILLDNYPEEEYSNSFTYQILRKAGGARTGLRYFVV